MLLVPTINSTIFFTNWKVRRKNEWTNFIVFYQWLLSLMDRI